MPSSPSELSPQVHNVPSERTAALFQPMLVATWVLPSPRTPWVLSPQAQTLLPVPATARVAVPLLATCLTPDRPGTAAGVTKKPPCMPSTPSALRPQANRVPSERTAKLAPLADTWLIPVRPRTCTGARRLVVVPSP